MRDHYLRRRQVNHVYGNRLPFNGRRSPTSPGDGAGRSSRYSRTPVRVAKASTVVQPSAALEAIRSGDATGLIVAKPDRLSRSLLDFAGLMERSRKEGWLLVTLDLGVDTSTRPGR